MATRHHHATASEKKKEDWMNSKWRPMMGWMYMAVCACDFMLFPILWSLLQSLSHGTVQTQWQPLTLQGAGLFHVAMGAVLGIAAYGRTQEKLGGANNGGIQMPPNAGTTYIPPNSNTNTNINLGNQSPAQNSSFGGMNNGGFSSNNTSFGGGSAYGAPAAGGFGSPSGFGSPAPTNSFGSTPLGGNSASGFVSAPASAAAVTTGYQGKKAPPDPVFPSI